MAVVNSASQRSHHSVPLATAATRCWLSPRIDSQPVTAITATAASGQPTSHCMPALLACSTSNSVARKDTGTANASTTPRSSLRTRGQASDSNQPVEDTSASHAAFSSVAPKDERSISRPKPTYHQSTAQNSSPIRARPEIPRDAPWRSNCHTPTPAPTTRSRQPTKGALSSGVSSECTPKASARNHAAPATSCRNTPDQRGSRRPWRKPSQIRPAPSRAKTQAVTLALNASGTAIVAKATASTAQVSRSRPMSSRLRIAKAMAI